MSPATAVSTTAARTAFGRFSREAGEKEQAECQRDRGEYQGKRRARARLVVDCRLREAARHRIALSQPRREIGRADAEEFLPCIHRVAVLGGKGARGGDTFNIGEQQASSRQWHDALDIAQTKRRAIQGG